MTTRQISRIVRKAGLRASDAPKGYGKRAVRRASRRVSRLLSKET